MSKIFNQYKNIIIISPHIDDARYSLGCIINKLHLNLKVTIINVFSISNFVYSRKETQKLATEIRKNEDFRVYSDSNINLINLDFPEALLRKYPIEKIFLGKIRKNDLLLLKRITNTINKIFSTYEDSLILLPLGYGNHVDHVLCNMLRTEIKNKKFFYEELPYASRNYNYDYAEKQKSFLKKITICFDKRYYQSHISKLNIYESQITNKHLIEISNYFRGLKINLWH